MVCDEHRTLSIFVVRIVGLASFFLNAISVPLAKLIQGQYIIIERWSRRAPAGKHIVDRVIGLSVGAQAWNSCEPVYRFCGLDSCPESMDDGICAVWGACLDFLCHARGLSVQLDSSLGRLAAGELPCRSVR